MSAYGGKGPMVNGILWAEVVITAVFVGLRLYTRKEILNAVGADDYLCILALVSPAYPAGSPYTHSTL